MKKTKQLFAGLMMMAFGCQTAFANYYQFNLMEGVTGISQEIYRLHMLIFWICVAIGVAVFGTMFYSIYHHRKSKGHKAEQFHHNTTVEIVWTIIPTLILIGMAIPATKAIIHLDEINGEKQATPAQMTIKVTGKQWYWDYEYINADASKVIHFESHLDEDSERVHRVSSMDPKSVANYLLNVDRPLVVPVKTRIRFLFTAADVIHSWWVPDLGWKKDANPGFVNEAWTYIEKPGVFRGQCTELCGRDHGFMPIVVIAMEQTQYDEWVKTTLAQQSKLVDVSKRSVAQLMSAGESVYLKNCVACHQIDGKGVSGWYPSLVGSSKVTGDINQLDGFVAAGTSKMPSFKKLSADQKAALYNYLRNSPQLGNKVGDELQTCQALTADELDDLDDAVTNNDPKPSKICAEQQAPATSEVAASKPE